MSDLQNAKPRPAGHIENGHNTALRDGAAFVFDPLTLTIAAGVTMSIRFVTGSLATIFEGASIGINQEEVVFQVFEDTTFSNNGVLDTTIIRAANRMSNRLPQMVTYTAPIVNVLGAMVLHDVIRGSASQGQNKPGFGIGSQVEEVILKPNTEHVFQIINNSAAGVDLEAHMFYRESNPKEWLVSI